MHVQTEREANFRIEIAYKVTGKTQVDANLSGTAQIDVSLHNFSESLGLVNLALLHKVQRQEENRD